VIGSVDVLVLAELQREYTTDGRPFRIASIGSSLALCRSLLATARRRGWIVAHVRRVQDGLLFNPTLVHGRFEEGFEPTSAELVFDNPGRPGAMAAPGFADFVAAVVRSGARVHVAGYAGEHGVLATLIDLAGQGLRPVLLADATASCAVGGLDEAGAQAAFVALAGRYADVARAADLLHAPAVGLQPVL